MGYEPRFISSHSRDAGGTPLRKKREYRRRRSYLSIARIEERFKDEADKGRPADVAKGWV